MQPLVQSALEAAKHGENGKALELLKQALAANPNDVDAWLVLAAVVEQPERKRQCLNRILALDPTNQIAREELLEMDGPAMDPTPASQSKPAPAQGHSRPVSNSPRPAPPPEPEPISQAAYAAADQPIGAPGPQPAAPQDVPVTPQLKPSARPSPAGRQEKPLVFKYLIVYPLLAYFFLFLLAGGGLYVMTKAFLPGLVIFSFSLLPLLLLLGLATKVEVTQAGIRVEGIVNSTTARWAELQDVRKVGWSNDTLQLRKRDGKALHIPTQLSRYQQLLEIIREKRPDLFGMVSTGQGPAFSGTKIFQKSLARLYGMLLLYLPGIIVSGWIAATSPQHRLGGLIAAVGCAIMSLVPLFQIYKVKLEPNKLTIATGLEEKTFSGRQIREIRRHTVRERYGILVTMVKVTTVRGRTFSLSGFAEDDEIILGFLRNWWNTYKNA